MKEELKLRKNYLSNEKIETIYFGGGTPSLLSAEQINELILTTKHYFEVSPNAEITLEANPDDLSTGFIASLLQIGINRLSIGIQSFIDSDLKFMNRRHSGKQAIEAVKNAQNAGFSNISIDLIYGLPTLSTDDWKYNLNKMLQLDIQHVSSYHLTYHENTALWKQLQNRSISELPEENSLIQFQILIETCKSNGFIHYEISNFSKPGYFSRHNSSYWMQKKYLGIGPSAHSFNELSRQWNISEIKKYIESIQCGSLPFEIENLSLKDKYNDYVITGIRTMWGIDCNYIQSAFGKNYLDWTLNKIDKFVKQNMIQQEDGKILLTYNGMFVSDGITEDLITLKDL
jgi:oxygen-independent coproporphyrinogen III oxidase